MVVTAISVLPRGVPSKVQSVDEWVVLMDTVGHFRNQFHGSIIPAPVRILIIYRNAEMVITEKNTGTLLRELLRD